PGTIVEPAIESMFVRLCYTPVRRLSQSGGSLTPTLREQRWIGWCACCTARGQHAVARRCTRVPVGSGVGRFPLAGGRGTDPTVAGGAGRGRYPRGRGGRWPARRGAPRAARAAHAAAAERPRAPQPVLE